MHRSPKKIRIACLGIPNDYHTSLIPLIIQSLGYKIDWVSPIRADLIIYGSFYKINYPQLRWMPRVWRSKAKQWLDLVHKELSSREFPPITLFHTAENLRHSHIQADFAISHDLNINSNRHFRLPYWMEVIDWSFEGIVGNKNPRYGELLKLERLMTPLGNQFLKRQHKAVLITSHLREPRAFLYNLLKKIIPVDGMGSYFNEKIKNHHKSGFSKKEILNSYAFNLCPENGLHPGYLTEKIPEAFAAGCLPISLVDSKTNSDFNNKAFINIIDYMEKSHSELEELFYSKEKLRAYSSEPLMLKKPSIYPISKWISSILLNGNI